MQVVVDKKRAVRKVRSSYLNKSPLEDGEVKKEAAPVSLNEKNVNVLSPSIGLIEANGRVRLATHFLTLTYEVISIKVQENSASKVVSLLLQKKNIISEPWEYTAKRLEDSGELEMVIWAQRIRRHYTEQPKIMEEYFKSLNSRDLHIQNNIRKAQNKAKLASQDIENKYEYFKICLISSSDGILPLSLSYTEKIINSLGHTIETFVPWVEANGIPPVSPGSSPAFLEISRQFLECLPLTGSPVQKGPEFSTYIFNEDGSKTDVEVQFIGVIDPVAKGIFLTGYYIIKREGYEIVIQEDEEDKIEITEKKVDKEKGEEKKKPSLFPVDPSLPPPQNQSQGQSHKIVFQNSNTGNKGDSIKKVTPGIKFKKFDDLFPDLQ